MNKNDTVQVPSWRDCCFFFDVDGTLAELQLRPEQVFIPDRSLDALARLSAGGVPVAVVSGRPLSDIDRLLQPLQLPAAGVHGAERRNAAGQLTLAAGDPQRMAEVGHALEAACRAYPRLRLENKGVAFALHFREAPELQVCARQLAEDFLARYDDLLTLQPGKCVYELKPRGASKGEAIDAFLQEPPFHGRRPVFLGDDLTDEAGFRLVNRLGGHSIKVGPGQTEARAHLDSVSAVEQWLARLLADFEEPPPGNPIQQESKESP